MITSIVNLIKENKGFGSIIRVWLLTLLALIICTCSGAKLTLGNQTLGNQTDYSLYSGRLVKQTHDLTECVILKTDVPDFLLCLQQKPLTWRQLRQMHGTVSCLSLAPMLRKCSRTRLYQYQSTTRFSSNPSRTVWTDQRPSLPTEFPRPNTPGESSKPTKSSKSLTGSTQRLTGKTQATTRTTGKN